MPLLVPGAYAAAASSKKVETAKRRTIASCSKASSERSLRNSSFQPSSTSDDTAWASLGPKGIPAPARPTLACVLSANTPATASRQRQKARVVARPHMPTCSVLSMSSRNNASTRRTVCPALRLISDRGVCGRRHHRFTTKESTHDSLDFTRDPPTSCPRLNRPL